MTRIGDEKNVNMWISNENGTRSSYATKVFYGKLFKQILTKNFRTDKSVSVKPREFPIKKMSNKSFQTI